MKVNQGADKPRKNESTHNIIVKVPKWYYAICMREKLETGKSFQTILWDILEESFTERGGTI